MGAEKQMFGKQKFAGPPFAMEHRGDFDQMGLASFLPITPNSY